MRIEAVIFDLFGTLVHAFPPELFRESLSRMAEALGLSGDVFSHAWISENGYKRHVGAFGSIEQEIRSICRNYGGDMTDGAIGEAVKSRFGFTRATLRPRKDSLSTLTALGEMGVRRGLISDCSPEVPGLLAETPLFSAIDAPVFSCSAGLKKPDPGIYALACRKLGVRPEQCFYVGDGFSQELSGARRMGMRAFLLRPNDEPAPSSAGWEGHDWDGNTIPTLGEVLPYVVAARGGKATVSR